jgi:signal transduction histidine kinase
LRLPVQASLGLEQSFLRVREEHFAQESGGASVDFRVTVNGEQRALHPVFRDEAYLIGREAILNAFRHAHAKKIEIDLLYSSKRFCLVIRDDGCGIDDGILRPAPNGHWGLSGMRERAERIGAQFRLTTNALAGTEIELSVPAHIAFRDSPSGVVKRRALKRHDGLNS